jgi:hypothetical protein
VELSPGELGGAGFRVTLPMAPAGGAEERVVLAADERR